MKEFQIEWEDENTFFIYTYDKNEKPVFVGSLTLDLCDVKLADAEIDEIQLHFIKSFNIKGE